MFFFLSSAQYITSQANTTKVKVHLRNGVAEILNNHQDLLGLVENNLVEIESNFENKVEKFSFIVQDAVFLVSNKGLDIDKKEMSVYVYAKNAYELNSSLPVNDISKTYEKKKGNLEVLEQKLLIEQAKQKDLKETERKKTKEEIKLSSDILVLKSDVAFLKQTLLVSQQLK
jgi:hypothetical protein